MSDPILNTVAMAELEVMLSDLAPAIALEDDDDFPPVFATSRMIALMEVAGARLLRPFLGEGELSVGVEIDVTHAAPTLPGSNVQAVARYLGREGKLYVLEVIAVDDGGEIGRGIHKRAIVANNRLLAGAARRADRVSH